MKAGTPVRVVQPEILGVVKERRIRPGGDELEMLVEWTTPAGEVFTRWFTGEQIQQIQEVQP